MSAGCWICGCLDSHEVKPGNIPGAVTSDDFKITDSQYGRTARIVQCDQCGFRYANPVPSGDLVEMYAQLNDPDYNAGRATRMLPLRQIIQNCRKLHPTAKTLLDVGASTGLLCRAAVDLGMDAVGVEPSKWAVEIAQNQEQVNVLEGVFPHPELAGRKFDIITLIDVIEHVSDPLDLLKALRAALAPSGVLAVVTPDVESLAARSLGHRWWHYRVAHVCYFSIQTMSKALQLADLRLLRQTTYSWRFPISYLAERVEQYLPTRWLRKGTERFRLGKRLLQVSVPLNLRDSRVYYATPNE